MTTYLWPNGIGASTGDSLGTCKPLETSGSIFYVDYSSGNDSNDGGDEARPKKTLGAAITASSANDIIALLPTHDEVIATTLVPLAGQTIVGLGRTNGKPSAKLTRGVNGNVLNLTNAGVQVRNVYFPQSTVATTATTTGTVRSASTGHFIGDCLFECGALDTAAAVAINTGTNYLLLRDCSFVSVTAAPSGGADTETPPRAAIINSASARTDIRMEGITIDGGVGGWGNYYAVDLSASAITRFFGERWRLLGGSDVKIHASTTGYLNTQTVEGSGKVFW